VALPSLTVEENLGGLTSRQIAGVRVNRLSLALAPGNVLMGEADCRGQAEQLITPTTPVYTSDEALHHNGFAAQVQGVESREIEAFELYLANNLVDDIRTAGGAGNIAKLPAGTFTVSGRFALGMEAETAYQTFCAGDYTSLAFTMTGATITSSWRYQLAVELPRVRYFRVDLPLAPGRLVYDIGFEALLDPTQAPATEAVVKLRNTVAGY
jgi:hypothetical protein